MRLIIADAGPLIGLARINKLNLLQTLFHKVSITAVVAEEIGVLANPSAQSKQPGQEILKQSLAQGWIEVITTGAYNAYQPLNPGVDKGEASAIGLALELRNSGSDVLLLIDDRCGRAEANLQGIPLIGTAAVLVLAKELGHIQACRPLLDALVEEGYYLSEALLQAVLQQAGEPPPN